MKKFLSGLKNIRKRKVLTAYIVILLVSVLLFLYVAVKERPEILEPRRETQVTDLVPVSQERVEDAEAPAGYYDRYVFQLPSSFRGVRYLSYRMIHEYTRVYVGDRIIFRIARGHRNRFGKTIGNLWAMVPVSADDVGRNIEVRIYPVYASGGATVTHFYYGDRAALQTKVEEQGLPVMIMSLIAVVIGFLYIGMFFFGTSVSRAGREREEYMSLGFFSLDLGLWRLSDTSAVTMMFPKASLFLSDLSLISLMLLPFSLLYCLWIRLRLSHRFLDIMSLCFAGVDGGILILQVLNVQDLRESLLLIHLSTLGAIALITGMWIREMRKNRNFLESNMNFLVFFLVFAGAIIDMLQYYYVSNTLDAIYTLLSIDIYNVTTGIYYFYRLRKDALIDEATGLYNKNQCQMKVDLEGPAKPGTMLIMCDLNGLKTINDNGGHEEGDRAIALIADALRKVYPDRKDFVGRFGGDEFIVILENVNSREEAEEEIRRLEQGIAEENQEGARFPVSCSCGYSLQSECPGEDLDYMLRQADMNMYANKRRWHQKAAEA